jgi:hypothetical protein
MKPIPLYATLGLLAALAGCASDAHLQAVRDFAAESSRFAEYEALSQRYRDTYQREQPYLSPAADLREKALDARRHESYGDFVRIERSVALYLQTLGQLAGDQRYQFDTQLTELDSAIRAWPDSGLEARHVEAYGKLTELLARAAGGAQQERSVQAMVRAGQQPLQELLDAMSALLRYYDKTSDNEKRIVLGTFETEIPYIDTPSNRLLAALAKSQQQDKIAEYKLYAERYRLGEQDLAIIATALQHLDQPDNQAAVAALEQACQRLRRNRDAAAVHSD